MYYHLNNDVRPRQGWKIHILASLKDAQKAITIIAKCCATEKVAFKYIIVENLYM